MVSPKVTGLNVSKVKEQNLQAILMHLLYKEPVYRVDLARDIAISTTTVAKIIDKLIEQGFVRKGAPENLPGRSVGRPKSAFYLNKDARFVIGIHIGGRKFRIGILNLRGEIVHYAKGEYEPQTPWEPLLGRIYEKLVLLLEESKVDRQNILGIGMGVPGLVDFSQGVIGYSKNLNWQDVPIKDFFARKFNYPIVVENNVRAMALSEALFGLGRHVDNLMFIYGSRGVGAGLVVDRGILRGIGQGAGEIGHTYLIQDNSFNDISDCCFTLEDLVSVPAIVARARAFADQKPNLNFSKGIQGLDEYETIVKVFQFAREGNPHAQGQVQKVCQYLGLALVNVINLTNPELIILGGIFADQSDVFLPTLREIVDTMSFANIGKQVDIRATNYGWKVGLVGAGALALAHFFYLPPSEVNQFNNEAVVDPSASR